MTIEFRCTGCQKLLRTKDDSAGKQARCPECGTLLAVPEKAAAAAIPPAATPTATVAPSAAPESPAAQQDVSDNPYVSPRTSYADDSQIAAPSGELRSTPMDVGETLLRTSRILWRNRGVCILATIIFAVLNMAPRFPIIQWTNAAAQRRDWGAYLGWYACDILLGILIYAYLGAGMRLFLLKIARGEPAPISTLFAGGPYYFTLVVAGMLYFLFTCLGLLALLIGTFLVSLFLWPYGYLIVDRNLGAIDSFGVAAKITAGNRLTVLATYLVASILGGAIVIIIAVIAGLVGFFASALIRFEFMIVAAVLTSGLALAPYLLLLPAVMYLAMTGQPIAEPRQE